MLHDTYSGFEAGLESTLHHNKTMLGCVQRHKSPFHHEEEVITRAFDARVTACFYQLLPEDVRPLPDHVDNYIRGLNRVSFLDQIETIRRYIFNPKEQWDSTDEEFMAHAKFLQQTETYKTLKQAIKLMI